MVNTFQKKVFLYYFINLSEYTKTTPNVSTRRYANEMNLHMNL